MKAEILYKDGDWLRVLNICRHTVNKPFTDKTPSIDWVHKALQSEHSPLRAIKIGVRFEQIPLYVSTQLLRHAIGVTPWQNTQRTDRTGFDRSKLSQVEPVNLILDMNLQSVINISKKRMCKQASPKTVKAWGLFLDELFKIMPETKPYCMPDCKYKGGCTEFKSCGYMPKKDFNII